MGVCALQDGARSSENGPYLPGIEGRIVLCHDGNVVAADQRKKGE
jgi:hypothetical protein